MQGDKYRTNLILLHVDIHFSKHLFLKLLYFLQFDFFGAFFFFVKQKVVEVMFTQVSVFDFVPLLYVSVLEPVPSCFYDYGSVMYLKTRNCHLPNLVLFVQDCFEYLGSFVVPYEFFDNFFLFL